MARIERTVVIPATMDLNRIATWVRVVDCGSFTGAARALGLPKSSVSRAIKRLEEELGLTLLQRTTRKLTLTRAGARYLVNAREALRLLDEARAELVNADGAPRGTVRMTAPVGPTSRVSDALAGALATFCTRYPGVHVEMIFTGRRVDLLTESIDLAVRAGTMDDNALVARKIASDQLILVAAPAYLSEHGAPRRLSDLLQHRVILFNGSEGSQRIRLSGPAGVESVVVRGPINVDEMGFQLPLAECGVGIALMPGLLVEDSLQEGRVVRVLPQYARKEGAIYLVYAAQRQVPKRVTLLRDFMYDRLKRELSRPAR